MAITKPRVESRKRATRLKLLKSAYALLKAGNDLESLTIQQITDGADIGFGTFYNYFDSKEAAVSEALDCLIQTLGRRNDLLTATLVEHDPVRVVANSVRFVIHEFVNDPFFRWWLDHPGKLVPQMREGLKVFGMRDINRAVLSGDYHLASDDQNLAWSQMGWLVTAGASDIAKGYAKPEDERVITIGVLQMLGVAPQVARAAVAAELVLAPPLKVDFSATTSDKA